LALLFGPLGLLYATIKGGLIMLALDVAVPVVFLGAAFAADPAIAGQVFLGSVALIWGFLSISNVVCVVWAILAAQSYNRDLGSHVVVRRG
jgi:hypothetical protein